MTGPKRFALMIHAYAHARVQVLRMGKVLHQYALCDFDAADEFLVAMHAALLEVHAWHTHGTRMAHVWCM